MNQYSAIREVRRLLRAVMEQSQRPELIEQLEIMSASGALPLELQYRIDDILYRKKSFS